MMPVADHQEKRDSMAQQRVCSTHLEIPKQKQCAKGSCSICLESLFLPNQQIGYLSPCGHCFHLNCIQEWKAQTAGDRRASRCPLCDKRIEHCGKVFLQIDEYDKNEEEEKSFHQAEDVELPCSSSNGELAESERRTTELIAKLVYQVMWSTENNAVLESLEMLCSLTEDGLKTCESIALAGGIPAAVRAVRDFSTMTPPTVSIQASVLLGDMCRRDKSGQLQKAIVRAGAIQGLVVLIKKTIRDEKSLTIIFWTLATLAKQDDLTSKAADMRSAVVAQQQQIKVILAVMKLHPESPRLQAHGCTALFNLIHGPEDYSEDAVTVATQNKAVVIILNAMQKNSNSPDVQTNACCLLFRLCRGSADNSAAILAQGGIPLIIRAMKRYPDDKAVQRAGCCLVWSVNEHCTEGTKHALETSDGFTVLKREPWSNLDET